MKNLKIGQTFEVVEILTDSGFGSIPFIVGGHTIEFNTFNTLINNPKYDGFFRKDVGQKTLCLLEEDVKPIGKLTITKLK